MAEKERKSYYIQTPEVKNYDIQDIYDLEDCIEVLDSIVQELNFPNIKRSELSTVNSKKHMAKYVYMEDSILEGLEKLPKFAVTKDMQDKLLDATKKFNSLSFEFQEKWNAEYWEIYESTRDPKRSMNDLQMISQQQISKKLLDLQEIAITLTRMSRGSSDNFDLSGKKDPFAMVDEEASKYKQPSIKPKSKDRDCVKCVAF